MDPINSLVEYATRHEWSAMVTLILTMVVISLFMLSKILASTKMVRDAYFALKQAPHHSYQSQFPIESQVANAIDYIRHEVNADRVLICRIHNGVNDIVNNPLLKITCFNESVHKGIPPRAKYIQSIPISFCASFLTDLTVGRYVKIENVATASAEDDFYSYALDFIKKAGTKSAYIFPLEDNYGSLFGVVAVSFVRVQKTLQEDQLKWINNRCHGIGSLISLTKVDK